MMTADKLSLTSLLCFDGVAVAVGLVHMLNDAVFSLSRLSRVQTKALVRDWLPGPDRAQYGNSFDRMQALEDQ